MGGDGVVVLDVVLEQGGGWFHGDVVVGVDLHFGVESIEVEVFADFKDYLLDPGVDGADEGEGLFACGDVDADFDVVVFDLFHEKN